MPYTFNTDEEQRQMLEAIGASSIDELFDCIPESLRLDRPLDLPSALTELELAQHMSVLADRNIPAGERVCFLGGGSYDHFCAGRRGCHCLAGRVFYLIHALSAGGKSGKSSGDI